MKFKISGIICMTILFSTMCWARNTISTFPIQNALHSTLAEKAAVGNTVQFYFGNQAHGKILKTFGPSKTFRKTNAFMQRKCRLWESQ